MKSFNIFLALIVIQGGAFCSDSLKSTAELTGIEVPEEIVIRDGSEKELLSFELKISYKYSGVDVVSNNGDYGPFSFTQSFRKNVELYYFDKDGNVFPEAKLCQVKRKGRSYRSGEAGGSRFGLKVCLKNGTIYHCTCLLFPSSLLRQTDLLDAIKSRRLARGQVIFTDLLIVWELADGEDRKRIREGKFFFNIEKEFWIDVKYADAR